MTKTKGEIKLFTIRVVANTNAAYHPYTAVVEDTADGIYEREFSGKSLNRVAKEAMNHAIESLTEGLKSSEPGY